MARSDEAPIDFPLPHTDIAEKPGKLYNYLGDLLRKLKTLDERARTAQLTASSIRPPTLNEIRDALQAGGSHALNVEGLQGQSGAPQLPQALTFAAQPNPASYPPGPRIFVAAVA